MPFTQTHIKDLLVFEPVIWEDKRGYFYESYNRNTFIDAGIDCQFVQDNQAKSGKGVLRGLHYQVGEHGQSKLVRVLQGSVQDIAVDIRPDSPTYGATFSVILSGENKKQLFVPRGFAHGYLTLTDDVVFAYKCDNFYSKESEGGIIYNDPTLDIKWEMDLAEVIVSEKDTVLPLFNKHRPA